MTFAALAPSSNLGTVSLPPATFAIAESIRAELRLDLAAWAEMTRDPRVLAEIEALRATVELGVVPAPLLPTFERLLDLALSTGRARRLHGPEVERAYRALFRSTPEGERQERAIDAVNGALRGLVGRPLAGVEIESRGPGVIRIEIATETVRIALDVDAHGLSVASLTAET